MGRVLLLMQPMIGSPNFVLDFKPVHVLVHLYQECGSYRFLCDIVMCMLERIPRFHTIFVAAGECVGVLGAVMENDHGDRDRSVTGLVSWSWIPLVELLAVFPFQISLDI
jgi:hypothetical protein